jgi:hypothetical protein
MGDARCTSAAGAPGAARRWYYSSWREGEWLAFDAPEKLPFRKLVRTISRVAAPHAQDR